MLESTKEDKCMICTNNDSNNVNALKIFSSASSAEGPISVTVTVSCRDGMSLGCW